MTFDIDANGILDVKAKDRATGKEQQVRITASSMLDKSDVDQMVRDAEEHAEEDRKRREEVETRNQAEALTFQAERTLKDLGDKVSSEDKLEVENKVASLREALKGSDIDVVRSRHDVAGRDAAAGLDRRLPGRRRGGRRSANGRPATTADGTGGWPAPARERPPTRPTPPARRRRGRVQGGLGLPHARGPQARRRPVQSFDVRAPRHTTGSWAGIRGCSRPSSPIWPGVVPRPARPRCRRAARVR